MKLFGKKKKKADDAAEDAEAEAAPEKEEKEAEKDEAGKEGAEKTEGAEGAEGAEAAGDEADAKKKKKKLIIIGAAGALMLAVVGGAGAYFFIGHGKEPPKAVAMGDGKPVYYDVPQLLVNLNTGSKTPSFIKATVTLELSNPSDVPIAQANLPRLLDSYNTFLREMKASDLYGSAGMYRLREEMLLRANTTLAPVKVKDVLFKEILVQ